MANEQFDINAFVPSQQTSSMLAPQTGTAFDPLIQLFGGVTRQRQEQAAFEAQQLASGRAAELEQERFDIGQERFANTAQAKIAAAGEARKNYKAAGDPVLKDGKMQQLMVNALGKTKWVGEREATEAEKAAGKPKETKAVEVSALQLKRSGQAVAGNPKFARMFDTDGKPTAQAVNAANFHANQTARYRSRGMSEQDALEMANEDLDTSPLFNAGQESTYLGFGQEEIPATFRQQGVTPEGELPIVTSKQQYDALAAGTQYRDSKGNIGTKR